MTQGQTAAAGWYPHPEMANTLRYWDGQQWTDHISPMNAPVAAPPAASSTLAAPGSPTPPAKQSQVIAALVMVGCVIGFIMSMQSASLLTGTGALWTGVAIVCGAAIAAWVMRQSTPKWVRIVATILAVVAIANVVSMETQLQERQQELSDLFK